jgi:hypothetical protein
VTTGKDICDLHLASAGDTSAVQLISVERLEQLEAIEKAAAELVKAETMVLVKYRALERLMVQSHEPD